MQSHSAKYLSTDKTAFVPNINRAILHYVTQFTMKHLTIVVLVISILCRLETTVRFSYFILFAKITFSMVCFFFVFQAITKGDDGTVSLDRSFYVELFEDSDGSPDNHICSGVLFSERWILTSCQCRTSNNTQPWVYVGFRRYRGGGTSSYLVLRSKATHSFNDQAAPCKKNPLLMYELPRVVIGATSVNITNILDAPNSRPFVIGVSRISNTSESLNLNIVARTTNDLYVSEANATGHLDEHDSGAGLFIDRNIVGINSHRVNANLVAFTNLGPFKNQIMRLVDNVVGFLT